MLSLTSVKQNYEAQLKVVNEQVEFYKNCKAQQSTKAIGESLEQYAESEFNKVHSFAFPNAYFEKDNKVSARGSKGDSIFRDFDENGLEFISIIFEMKNEADGTEKKYKNADFYKELDKDHREKNCEYAVLVSMLEEDIDITHFEEDLDAFKVAFAKNYNSASVNFGKAIDESTRPLNGWKRSKNSSLHLITNFASPITNWMMFSLKN